MPALASAPHGLCASFVDLGHANCLPYLPEKILRLMIDTWLMP